MKIFKNGKWEKIEGCERIELEHDDKIQLLVPASLIRTSVNLVVTKRGKLEIAGGSSIIEEISGPGMSEKVKE